MNRPPATSALLDQHHEERPPYDRRRTRRAATMPWLWLACGAALLPFTLLQTTIAAAAWLAPLFLLRFARTTPARWAMPALAITGALAACISFRGALPMGQMLLIAAGGAVLTPIPYAADRLLRGRLTGLGRTLVFPMADTVVAYFAGNGDFGTMGHIAGTQVENLPLLQTAAVAGQWAIGFLLMWAVAVANDVWEGRGRRSAVICGVVLGVVLLLGGARLVFAAPAGPNVRIAGIAPDRAATDALTAAAIAPGPRTAPQRTDIQARLFEPLLADLLSRTRQAARSGADIVVWAEASAFTFLEDRETMLDRVRALAREERIYLQIGVVHLLPATAAPFTEIRAILVDPDGAVRWDYLKTSTPLGDGNVPGPGILPTLDTPYGRLSTVICFDASFPGLIRQAGRAGVDILLVPSSDWEQVTAALAEQATLRAVENGVNLVRPARLGTSVAVDHHGRILARDNSWFAGDAGTSGQTMIVSVPTHGARTPYAVLFGDVLCWLSLGGLVIAVAMAIRRHLSDRKGTP
ncbi:MAG: nitrilase-related carbon-nitrogen hydrolase [Actinoplanes sp.]